MDTVFTRTREAAQPLSRAQRAGVNQPSLRGFLAAVARGLAERVTLPHRDLPPEWFRYPLP
jgi:hypothetical protein